MPTTESTRVIGEHLHTIAQLLREADHLEPETQARLAALADELSQAVRLNVVPSAELAHLTASTAALVEMVRHQREAHVVAAGRQRLAEAIVNVESAVPNVAGIGRRILEALTNLGI